MQHPWLGAAWKARKCARRYFESKEEHSRDPCVMNQAMLSVARLDCFDAVRNFARAYCLDYKGVPRNMAGEVLRKEGFLNSVKGRSLRSALRDFNGGLFLDCKNRWTLAFAITRVHADNVLDADKDPDIKNHYGLSRSSSFAQIPICEEDDWTDFSRVFFELREDELEMYAMALTRESPGNLSLVRKPLTSQENIVLGWPMTLPVGSLDLHPRTFLMIPKDVLWLPLNSDNFFRVFFHPQSKFSGHPLPLTVLQLIYEYCCNTTVLKRFEEE